MRRQAGVALVSVLLIVAVATALAYQMATRHTLNIAQSSQLLNGSQARQYALGGEEFARQILYADWLDEETRGNDTLLESWAGSQGEDAEAGPGADAAWQEARGSSVGASRSPADENTNAASLGAVDGQAGVASRAFVIDDGGLTIRIDDLSSRFNLNAVVGSGGAGNFARFQRLLDQFGVDAGVADAWRDWIDHDGDIHGHGAEDAEYLLRDPPLRTANQRAFHVSELLVATTLSAQQYDLLRPHMTVLPVEYLRVNVNTASAAMLQALAPNFDRTEAQMLTASEREFEDIESFIAEHAPLAESADLLAVTTEFFRIQIRAEVGDSRADLTSVVYRDSSSGALTLVSRNFGETFEGTGEESSAEETPEV